MPAVDARVSLSGIHPRTSAAQAFFAHWLAQRDDRAHRYELVRGRVECSPAPGPHAAQLARWLHQRLRGAAERRGAQLLGPRCMLELPGGDTLTADVAIVSGTRAVASRATGSHGAIAEPILVGAKVPELVVDILAVSPARRERGGVIERRTILAEAGVREHWLVDPRAQTVTVLALDGDRLGLCGVLRRHQSLDLERLLGVVLPVTLLFRPPIPLSRAPPVA